MCLVAGQCIGNIIRHPRDMPSREVKAMIGTEGNTRGEEGMFGRYSLQHHNHCHVVEVEVNVLACPLWSTEDRCYGNRYKLLHMM
jgi:hypothetical protein